LLEIIVLDNSSLPFVYPKLFNAFPRLIFLS